MTAQPYETENAAGRVVGLRLISPDIPSGQLTASATLPEFYDRFFLPHVGQALRRHTPGTVQLYRDALAWWERLTPNPALADIDRHTLADFVAALCDRLAVSTVRKHLGNLNRVFKRTAGRFGTTAELLAEAPRFELPLPPADDVADCWTPAEVRQLIAAADSMKTPKLELSPAPSSSRWWATFVAVAYLHGFRCGTMLQLDATDLVAGQWRIPARKVKGRRKPLVRDLHPEAAELLAGCQGRFWPWYEGRHSRRFFFRQFKRLVRLAEVREFGTHGLRRAHATTLAQTNPEHARLSLGHSLFSTTATHYINAAVTGKAGLGLTLRANP